MILCHDLGLEVSKISTSKQLQHTFLSASFGAGDIAVYKCEKEESVKRVSNAKEGV